jgi:hypothetical protein
MSGSRKAGGAAGISLVREAAAAYTAMAAGAERPVRKNHYLYQSKIDLARGILGVRTETDALDAALDLLIYGESLARGTEAMVDETYEDVLGLGAELPSKGDGG